jgi:hypothetical protein
MSKVTRAQRGEWKEKVTGFPPAGKSWIRRSLNVNSRLSNRCCVPAVMHVWGTCYHLRDCVVFSDELVANTCWTTIAQQMLAVLTRPNLMVSLVKHRGMITPNSGVDELLSRSANVLRVFVGCDRVGAVNTS